MAQSHIALRALAARRSEDIRAARYGGFFPLTPALSLGERVHQPLRGGQSRPVGFPLPNARCSLSLRERARVRGNGANYHPAYQTIPGTVELGESSGRAGGFPEMTMIMPQQNSQCFLHHQQVPVADHANRPPSLLPILTLK